MPSTAIATGAVQAAPPSREVVSIKEPATCLTPEAPTDIYGLSMRRELRGWDTIPAALPVTIQGKGQ